MQRTKPYKAKEIEKKVIARWEKEKVYSLKSDKADDPKYYMLEMFPYP